MSVYSEVFSIDSLNLSSSFRISFKKNKPEPPSDTYTIRFVNNDYPNVLIPLPESRTVSSGSSIALPEVQGTYEDQDNYYVPQSWSIGNFNEEIIVNSNLEANLILSVTPKTTTYTIVFTNTTYPQFDVHVPEDMIVEEGNSVELPSVGGTFEDSENIYTPQKWSIGDFGETITPTSSMTADLLWNVQQKIVTYTVSFVNTQLPDIQIDMPQSETGEAGTTITLPTMSGKYEYDGKTYHPVSWSIGSFGSSYTLTQDVTAELNFEEVDTSAEVYVFVPASGSSFSGYNTVCAAYDLDGNLVSYSDIEDYITGNSSMVCVVQYANSYSPNYDTGYVERGLQVSQCLSQSSGNVVWKSQKYYQNDRALLAAFISDPQGSEVVNLYRKTAPYDCYVSYYKYNKYFILDGVHKQWVDDIDAEGFQLTPIENVGYLERRGGYGWLGKAVSGSYSIILHEANENNSLSDHNASSLSFADNKSYTLLAVYKHDGTVITSSFTGIVRSSNAELQLDHSYISNEFRASSATYSSSPKLPDVTAITSARFASSSAPDTTIQSDNVSSWLYTGPINSGSTINRNDNYGITVAVGKLIDENNNVVERTGVEAVWDNTNGGQTSGSTYRLSVKNNTASSITCRYANIYKCYSNLCDVTVITVYNSSNEAFNAFKYNDGTTDYYYVLDDTQINWISDLSTIGYSLTSPLPTVTKSNLRVEPNSNEQQIGAGSEKFLYEYVNESYRGLLYDDTTKKQCAYGWRRIVSSAWESHYYGVSAVLKNGTSNSLGVRNDTQNTIYVYYILYAECSDASATVVTVYNSSNNPYNSFKYTLNGVNYYYVLDGVQNDWTDNLSSIGYSLEPTVLYAYFNVNNPGVNVSLFGSSDGTTQYNRLYDKDDSGSTSEISFDPSYTYTVLHVYKEDGTEVLPSGGRFELGDSSNYLRLLFFNGGPGWVAAKIEYTKSSTEMTAYFNSGTKNNQKTVSSGWGTGGDQMEILYPLNSGKTIPYDSTKTYKVKTVFYKNYVNPVTITNNYVTIDDLNYAGVHQGYLLVHTHVNNPATGDVCGCTYTVE